MSKAARITTKGHEFRSSKLCFSTSALQRIADSSRTSRHVRNVPTRDSCTAPKKWGGSPFQGGSAASCWHNRIPGGTVLGGCHSEGAGPIPHRAPPGSTTRRSRFTPRSRRASTTRSGRNKEGDMRPIITATTIVALAIAVAPITRAQQADDQTKQAIETMVAKWAQAVSKGDSETASSFFTPDAINIDAYGRTPGAKLGDLTQK